MRLEIKKRWVEALRSGEFLQVRGALQHSRPEDGKIGYCCLGVLCEIAVQDGVVERGPEGSYAGETSLLPHRVYEWADLHSINPEVRYEDAVIDDYNPNGETSLSNCNDNYRLSFEEIADLVEKQL